MSINSFLRPAGSFVKALGENQQGAVAVRDYRHAARIFTDSDYRLSPKYGFLFYVEFDFNPAITNISNTSSQEMGMIVKTVSLPKFTMDVKMHNAYNRKNYVQNSIKYDPVSIVFHDDQANTVTNFWYDYYSFYYQDPKYVDSTYALSHKYVNRPSFDWGYTLNPGAVGNNNPNGYQAYQYIQAIRIYSLYQKKFSEYELINPIITKFDHGQHNNGEGTSLLENSMTVEFETVKYYTGYTTANTVGGYVDLHYDNQSSPIGPSQGTDLVDDGSGGYSHATARTNDLAQTGPLFVPGRQIVSETNLSPIKNLGSTNFQATVGYSTTYGGTNAGGYSLPNLGNLPTGLPSSSSLLNSAQVTLANQVGATVGQASSQLVGQLSAKLGANGSAIVGIVATVAAGGGKQLLKTAENMAIVAGTNLVAGALQKGLSKALDGVSTTVANSIGDATSWADKAAGSLFGNPGDTLSQEISGLYNNVSESFTNLASGNGFINNTVLANQWGAAEAVVAEAEAAYTKQAFAEPW